MYLITFPFVGRHMYDQRKYKELVLGNTDAKRDWGYSKDYAMGMYLAMQYKDPSEWVFATGETHSVQEFVDKAFKHVNLDPKEYVKQDPRFMRPAEVDYLCGNSSKARKILGWEPSVTFDQLVGLMVNADLEQ